MHEVLPWSCAPTRAARTAPGIRLLADRNPTSPPHPPTSLLPWVVVTSAAALPKDVRAQTEALLSAHWRIAQEATGWELIRSERTLI